jgi:hypothetical protein
MTAFPAEYEARYLLEWASRAPDVVLTNGVRPGPERLIEVALPDGSAWLVSVAAFPDPSRRAVSGLFPTASSRHLLAVERGAAYLVDVGDPGGSYPVTTYGAVVGVRPVPQMDLLLLWTDWAVTAVGPDGVAWRTTRVAIEGIRIDEVENGRARGVADPDDDEPRNFVIDLRTGEVQGGAQVL